MRETYGVRGGILWVNVSWVVCKMGVSEGFMTRRAVTLELVCAAQSLWRHAAHTTSGGNRVRARGAVTGSAAPTCDCVKYVHGR
jgi:hypothetical protein